MTHLMSFVRSRLEPVLLSEPYGLSAVFRRLNSQGAAMVDGLLECFDLRPAPGGSPA